MWGFEQVNSTGMLQRGKVLHAWSGRNVSDQKPFWEPPRPLLGLRCISRASINIKDIKPVGLKHWRRPVQTVLGFFFLFVQ